MSASAKDSVGAKGKEWEDETVGVRITLFSIINSLY